MDRGEVLEEDASRQRGGTDREFVLGVAVHREVFDAAEVPCVWRAQ